MNTAAMSGSGQASAHMMSTQMCTAEKKGNLAETACDRLCVAMEAGRQNLQHCLPAAHMVAMADASCILMAIYPHAMSSLNGLDLEMGCNQGEDEALQILQTA